MIKYNNRNRTFLKDKITKQLQKNGEKNTVEKIVIQSFKKLQAESNKKSKDIIILTLRNSITFFKLHRFEQKKGKRKKIKEIPGFILHKMSRNSSAIKNILLRVKNDKGCNTQLKLSKEILINAQNLFEESVFTKKKDLNKQINKHSHLFKYFKLH